MFAFSILYLFALFAILLLEVVVKAILPLVW
jgi:protoheme IX farnesyltransferase